MAYSFETIVEMGRVFKSLSQRERQAVLSRYGFIDGEPKTLAAVGREMKITRERVRQIIERSKTKVNIILDYNK